MGIFGFLKSKSNKVDAKKAKSTVIRNSSDSYVDGSSVALDERPYYKPDSYYTYYSYPGTHMATKVISFEKRKKISYPSVRGLYVAEIMFLDYCKDSRYPKPSTGYPGFWWFEYGIRDVGHALESLEQRGFIRWASKKSVIKGLKTDDLKHILANAGLSTSGKKQDLINRIVAEISEDSLVIPDYIPKYELTDIGLAELTENGYVPYMHQNVHRTTEGSKFGTPFNVWEINKLFPNGDAKDWRRIVGDLERKLFGVNMAMEDSVKSDALTQKSVPVNEKRDEMRKYLAGKQNEINKAIRTKGDGFEEESQGLDYKSVGKDKEALVKFYISIGKKFDAPALYRETAIILRKYGMYEEELSVIEAGLKNLPKGHRDQFVERKKKVIDLIKKQHT